MPVRTDRACDLTHCSLNFGLYIIFTVFVLFLTVQVFADPIAKVNDKYYLIFMSVLYVMLGNSYAAIVRTRDTFVPFLRRYIQFLENGERIYEKMA